MGMNDSTLAKVPFSSIHPSSKKVIRNKHFVATSTTKNGSQIRDCGQDNNPNDVLKEVLDQFGRTSRVELGPQSNQKRIKRRNAIDLTGPTIECYILRHGFLLIQSRQYSENQDEISPRPTSLKSSFTNRIIGVIQQKRSQIQSIASSMTSNSRSASQPINTKTWRCVGLAEFNEEEDGALEDISQEIKEKARDVLQEQDNSNLWSFTKSCLG